jgi:hypothetical protein
MSVCNDGKVFFCMGAKRGVRPEGAEDRWLGEVWFCGGSVTTLEKEYVVRSFIASCCSDYISSI